MPAKKNLSTPNAATASTRPAPVVAMAETPTPTPEPTTLFLYSGNIMKIKPETGYVLLMVRRKDAAAIQEEAMALFLEDEAHLIDDLKLKVGDEIAYAAQGYVQTDMELPRDGKPVRKPYGWVKGSLAVVRRKQVVIESVVDTEAPAPSAGVLTRLGQLATDLAARLTGK